MKNKSIWLENIVFPKANKLNKKIKVDVLIIGGGITGLSTAYHLKNSNLKVCLVEKKIIGHGITSRTTGKLTYLQENIYSKLKDKAYKYYESQKTAIELVKSIILENKIDCDYEEVDSYIFTTNDVNSLKKEEKKLKELKIKYKVYDKIPFPIACKYAIGVKDTAVFHPIKYLIGLKQIITKSGIKIYENSTVTSIKKDQDKYICIVNDYEVIADKVVIATHYPYFLYPYFLPLKTYLEKSYVSASINETCNFSAITISKPVKSIRFHKDLDKSYVIYLNGTHNLCTKYNNEDNFNYLITELKKINLKPSFIWSNHDIMTEDSLPYIGYIDDNLLIGTGYNAWGMTNGSLAGKILSDLIIGNQNEYKDLFDPKRAKQLKNIIKYPLYISYSIKSFIENKIKKNKDWYENNVRFTKIDGKNVAIYLDEDGVEHIVYNLCPHLKCSLIFNEVEKTWDCPCHGSRFDIDGKCIFGPSKEDIGFNKNVK